MTPDFGDVVRQVFALLLFRNVLLSVLRSICLCCVVDLVTLVLSKRRAMAKRFFWCLIGMLVLSLLQLLLLEASASLDLALQDSPLLLSFLLQLGQVVRMRLSYSVFIESRHHLVVVSLRRVQQGLHVGELQQDQLELFVAIVDDLWSYQRDIGLIQQEPVSMLALKNLEVLVEECSIRFKLLLTCDLSLAVVGCIDQMVE